MTPPMTPSDDPCGRRMAAAPRVPAAAATTTTAVLWSVFLLLSSDCAGGNSTIPEQNNNSTSTDGATLAAILAPTLTLGVLAVALGVLAWLFCVVKKKRQTEGTYRPSAEEQSGVRGVAAPDALKLPKEERLI